MCDTVQKALWGVIEGVPARCVFSLLDLSLYGTWFKDPLNWRLELSSVVVLNAAQVGVTNKYYLQRIHTFL